MKQAVSPLTPREADSNNLSQIWDGELSYHHRCPQGQGDNQDRSLAHSGRSQGNFHSAETRTGQVLVHDIRQCLRTEAGGNKEGAGASGRRSSGEGKSQEKQGGSGVRPLTKARGKIWASAVPGRTDALKGAVSVGADAALAKVLLAALVHVCRTEQRKPRATSCSA